MRDFSQKQDQSQKVAFSRLAWPNIALHRSVDRGRLILPLHRTIDNPVTQQMRQTQDEELKAGLIGPASSDFGHDFSRIPNHPQTAGAIQTKLAVSQPGDEYEQEADHVSQRVMRMPEPQFKSPCSCGGECPGRQTKPAVEHLQTRRVQESATGQLAVPPIVHEVLRSPGQYLDSATRRFMEPRFGHDFSQVRVHTDAKAAESARAVNALAYTVGHDLVFGAGQYLPETNEGRRLVAHELTHVLQQTTAANRMQPANFISASGVSHLLQRKPTEAEIKQEQRLDDLAQNPEKAHQAWSKLSGLEQTAVVERMRKRYGKPFADQFLDEVKKGKPQFDYNYYPVGEGPTPDQLTARGFRLAGIMDKTAVRIEVWVHPSGRSIHRDVTKWPPSADESGKKPPIKDPPIKDPPIKDPPIKDPPTNDRAYEAMRLLADLHLRNSQLHDFCSAQDDQLGNAEDAQNEWNSSNEQLNAFNNVNFSKIYPDFWQDVQAARLENIERRRLCCERYKNDNFFFSCDDLKSK